MTDVDQRRISYQEAIEQAVRSPEILRRHVPSGTLVVLVRTVPDTGNSVVRKWTLKGDDPEYVVLTGNLAALQPTLTAPR